MSRNFNKIIEAFQELPYYQEFELMAPQDTKTFIKLVSRFYKANPFMGLESGPISFDIIILAIAQVKDLLSHFALVLGDTPGGNSYLLSFQPMWTRPNLPSGRKPWFLLNEWDQDFTPVYTARQAKDKYKELLGSNFLNQYSFLNGIIEEVRVFNNINRGWMK